MANSFETKDLLLINAKENAKSKVMELIKLRQRDYELDVV